jgi:ligand-binding sensor domain-containing protein/anti-sigma regulatory factor (Ser/Thr protein kinase)
MIIWNRHRALLLLLTLLVAHSFSFSQTYNFRNYTVDDGLPFINVNAIYQDTKGNLWIGGYGGLSKFNGKSFTNYSPKNGLANHRVLSITEDTAGHIWVGTLTGLSKLSHDKFQTYSQKDGLPDDLVSCLMTDSRSHIWIGTDNGICVYEGNKFRTPLHLLDSVNSSIKYIFEDNQHDMWIGTDKGIVIADQNGKMLRVINHFNGLTDDHVNCIFQDGASNYWIGTDKGLTRFEGNRKSSSSAAALNGLNVSSICQDLQGNIWISTEVGLWKYDGREFRNISISHDPNANKTSCLFLDYEKNLWIGTYSGLFRYRSADFVTYSQNDGLNTPFISQLSRDRNGNLLIATAGGGLNILSKKHFYSYTQVDGLPSNTITSVIEAKDGTVWIGSDKGISTCPSIRDPSKKPVFSKSFGLNSPLMADSVNIIFQDSKGTIWIGMNNGVTRYSKGVYTWMPIHGEKNSFSVFYFMEDQKGDLWVGTYLGGLFRYDGTSFIAMNKQLGMKSESCLAMLQDKEGVYYFGSFEGVYMYDPSGRYTKGKKPVLFSEADGLSSDLVYLMQFDDEQESIWIGTNQALNKFDLGAFKHSGKKTIVPYGKEEGFNGVECNGSAVCSEPDGSIWFGTVNGLIHYNPREYKPNKEIAKTNITRIRLFYSDTTLAQNAEMSYSNNNISFEYVGVCMTNPKKVRYRVKLDGFDKAWSPVTASSVATYSNLPPGAYSFLVMSCNNENIWAVANSKFSFTILAPFWKRWWFSVILSVFVAGMTVFLFRYRISQVREKENLKVRMATNELKALRSQMNPHFIFNSLNSIQHFIMNNDEVSASKYLNTFAKLIRTILNNSERATASIREEIDSLKLYLELEALRFENKFVYEIIVGEGLDLDYHEVPTMLIQPFAENAIIHGLLPKKGSGRLEIKIELKDAFILCSITDDGIGRKKALDMKEQSLRKTHKSFGLKITQDRLNLLNYLQKSSLNVNITDLEDADGNPKGTKVEIYIPVV